MNVYLKIYEGVKRPNFAVSRTSTPNQTTIDYSGQLIENLKKIIKSGDSLSIIGKGSMSDLRSVINFYKWIEWRLENIERVLSPRLIESSTEQNLIDKIITLESSIHKLRNSVKYCEFDVSDNEVLPSFIDFLDTFYDFYKQMYNRY
jgi:hypothetical protein